MMCGTERAHGGAVSSLDQLFVQAAGAEPGTAPRNQIPETTISAHAMCGAEIASAIALCNAARY
eukprot:2378208-Rhodomonas_salina.1